MKKIIGIIFVFYILILLLPSAKIKANNKKDLIVGLEASYAPFNFVSQKDNNSILITGENIFVSGYDIFISKIISDKLNLNLKIKKYSWDGLIPALNSGQIDMIVAGMSRTEERAKEIDFTIPYYESEPVIVFNRKSKIAKINNYKEIANFKSASQKGTLYTNLTKKIFQGDVNELEDYSALLNAISYQTSDFFLAEYPVIKQMIGKRKDIKYKKLSEINLNNIEKVPVNIGLKKNSPLLNQINNILEKINDNKKNELMEKAILLSNKNNNGFKENFKKYTPVILKGLLYTISISIAGTFGGLVVAILLLSVRNLKINKKRDNKAKIIFKKIGIYFSKFYITITRGTPMMVQAMIVFFGLGLYFNNNFWNPFTVSILIVIFNTAAYIAEILRSGVNAIDKGQYEAARSLGFSHFKANLYIIYPQAIKNSLPAIGNEFIVNLKDTSVLMVIGLTDLFNAGKTVASNTYQIISTWLIIALIYLVLTYATSKLIDYLELKRKKGIS